VRTAPGPRGGSVYTPSVKKKVHLAGSGAAASVCRACASAGAREARSTRRVAMTAPGSGHGRAEGKRGGLEQWGQGASGVLGVDGAGL
jgi:hypothetical protein